MKSPFTGGPVTLKTEEQELEFRNETFKIRAHSYVCEDTGTEFTTDELDEIDIRQVHNLYREKHTIPFPEEMQNIRKKYKLSARKMSLILGFGENQYNKYENGAIPSLSNARLIQSAKNPRDFREYLKDSGILEGEKLKKKIAVVEDLIYEEQNSPKLTLVEYLLGSMKPDEYNGFREPELEKAMHIILYFAMRLKPWETGMNKMMFYTDFLHFKRTCFSISGSAYRAIQYGPVPKRYGALFEEAETQGYINIKYDETRYEGSICKQFFPAEITFNKKLFAEDELKTLNDVATGFDGKKTSKISKISHQEAAWTEHIKNKELINYLYAFDLKALE
jgi:putative zinc finger/helix-turn-helix YgiT family protein